MQKPEEVVVKDWAKYIVSLPHFPSIVKEEIVTKKILLGSAEQYNMNWLIPYN